MVRQYKLSWAVCLAAAAAFGRPAVAGSLEAALKPVFASSLVKGASISMNVAEVGLKGAVELYGYNATTPLGPASNCKLLTTAAAFEKYGAHATFKTTLYKVGDDLMLVGGGDPALGDAKAPREEDRLTGPFKEFAAKAKAAGITHFHNLLVDDHVFDNEYVNPHWPADQRLDWYEAGVSGLNFNANCLDWMPTVTKSGVGITLMPETSYAHITNKATRGAKTLVSLVRPATANTYDFKGTVAGNPPADAEPYHVPVYDPGLFTATVLRDVLTAEGITSDGDVHRALASEQPPTAAMLATHDTPLLNAIKRANTNSINMMAECMAKRLGHDATGQPGSFANGTAAVTAYVTGLGVDPSCVNLDDGSGLSKQNKVAAKAFTTVLAHVASRPDGEAFVDTLAVPREDGTLKNRFKGMSVAEHIRAKTGHITGVSTLSGYIDLDGPTPRRFVFSILVNKYQGNVNPWQDEVCQAIYTWAQGK